ncbi:MAG: hypothetical protein LBN94_02790, partial [Puniceicoccales bacterium]|nr:hypothetical protein [Puniceicoccales bacterium]
PSASPETEKTTDNRTSPDEIISPKLLPESNTCSGGPGDEIGKNNHNISPKILPKSGTCSNNPVDKIRKNDRNAMAKASNVPPSRVPQIKPLARKSSKDENSCSFEPWEKVLEKGWERDWEENGECWCNESL